jgi:hypothetical protein
MAKFFGFEAPVWKVCGRCGREIKRGKTSCKCGSKDLVDDTIKYNACLEIYSRIYGNICSKHIEQLQYQSNILDQIVAPVELIAGQDLGSYVTVGGFQSYRKKLQYGRALAQVGFLPFEQSAMGFHREKKLPFDPGEGFKPIGHFTICWDISGSNSHAIERDIAWFKYTEEPLLNMSLLAILMLLQEAERQGHKVSTWVNPGKEPFVVGNFLESHMTNGGERTAKFDYKPYLDAVKYEIEAKGVEPETKLKDLGNVAEAFRNIDITLATDRTQRVGEVFNKFCSLDEATLTTGTEKWDWNAAFVYHQMQKADIMTKGTLFIFTDFEIMERMLEWKPYFLLMEGKVDIFVIHSINEPGQEFLEGYVLGGKLYANNGPPKSRVFSLMLEVVEDIDTLTLEIETSLGKATLDGKSEVINLSGATKGHIALLRKNNQKLMEGFTPLNSNQMVKAKPISVGHHGKFVIKGTSGKEFEKIFYNGLGTIPCETCGKMAEISVTVKGWAQNIRESICPNGHKVYIDFEDKKIIPRPNLVHYIPISSPQQLPYLVMQAVGR